MFLSVCNFQSIKSSVELNSPFSKFFCYITWFAILLRCDSRRIARTSGFIQNEKEGKEKKKKWVQELFRKWEEKGALNNLIQKMKLTNRKSFLRQDLICVVNIWFICDLFDIFSSLFFLLKHFFKFWNVALAWSTKDKNLKEF